MAFRYGNYVLPIDGLLGFVSGLWQRYLDLLAFSYRSDQPVTSFRDGFDESGFPGIISQRLTQAVNRAGQHLVGDEAAIPDGFNKLLAGNHLSRTPDHEDQDIH